MAAAAPDVGGGEPAEGRRIGAGAGPGGAGASDREAGDSTTGFLVANHDEVLGAGAGGVTGPDGVAAGPAAGAGPGTGAGRGTGAGPGTGADGVAAAGFDAGRS